MAEALKGYHGPEYVRTEVMIPVRDGVKLHTVILRPVGSEKERGGAAVSDAAYAVWRGWCMSGCGVKLGKPELAASGYIFVSQDIRGRYGPEGSL